MRIERVLFRLADMLENQARCVRVLGESLIERRQCRRVKNEDGLLTILSVQFDRSDRTYSYLAGIDGLQCGDRVIAPVGAHGHELVGTITEILHTAPEDAPYPLEQIKTIMRRADGGSLRDEG